MGKREIGYEEWLAEGERLFGSDHLEWQFVCPSCGHVQTVKDFLPYNAAEQSYFNCIGRYQAHSAEIFEKPGPCNYTGGGLFALNPVVVIAPAGKRTEVFEFAVPVAAPEPAVAS